MKHVFKMQSSHIFIYYCKIYLLYISSQTMFHGYVSQMAEHEIKMSICIKLKSKNSFCPSGKSLKLELYS
jgi:hypothetical protein